ncbi:MAG TPA: ABC transporter permease [Chloroflexota bacterium]|nr:ABC transporter permease [Chloroflexota bacterium]
MAQATSQLAVPRVAVLPVNFHVAVRWLSVIVFLGLWQAIALVNGRVQYFNPVFLPGPSDVIGATLDLNAQGILFTSLWTSGVRLLSGFILGAIFAVLLGFAMARYPLIDSIVDPILTMVGPIPPFAFLPMLIIWMGISWPSKVALVAYACFLPILAYTVDGVKHVDPLLIRSALSLGASDAQLFRLVVLPAALPSIFVGLRVSLALGFSALVVAEMVGASSGLGYLIMDARTFFKVGQMFSAAALIGAEYSLFAFILGRIEHRLFRWRQKGLSQAVA